MKRTVTCKIDTLSTPKETAWIISLSEAAAFETALLFSHLENGRVPCVKFADKSRSIVLSPAPKGYTLAMKDTQITVTQTWLTALSGMLMDVYFNGWTVTAHLDQDFGDVSVTVKVLPDQER